MKIYGDPVRFFLQDSCLDFFLRRLISTPQANQTDVHLRSIRQHQAEVARRSGLRVHIGRLPTGRGTRRADDPRSASAAGASKIQEITDGRGRPR